MPNYCNNTLYIEGNRHTINKIIDFVKSEENVFDFDNIVPMPKDIFRGNIGPDEMKTYGKSNWYDWSIENWGTKWNSIDAVEDDDCIDFLTAWSPCDPVIAALAAMFPTMRFTYTFYETGCGFCGERVYENGNLIFNYDGDYSENPACEEDDEWSEEYILTDTMFPIKDYGFNQKVQKEKTPEGYFVGKLYFREYENSKIRKMTDGNFVAMENYKFKFDNEQSTTVLKTA